MQIALNKVTNHPPKMVFCGSLMMMKYVSITESKQKETDDIWLRPLIVVVIVVGHCGRRQ